MTIHFDEDKQNQRLRLLLIEEEEKNDFGKEEYGKNDHRNQEDGDSRYREEDGDFRNQDKDGDSSTVVACNDSTGFTKKEDSPLITELSQHMAGISPKKDSLPSILRSYKSAVTKHANRLGFEFAWQSKYHDHIIRDEAAYQRIAQYIENNPSKWKEDGFF